MCGEQAVGVGREQGDQGGGCVMVQEGEDGGGAGVRHREPSSDSA